jgi:uncharacterized protein involved in exopolysaccharide biosynthesis
MRTPSSTRLEEQQADRPNARRPTVRRQQELAEDRLDQKQQEGPNEDRQAVRHCLLAE